MEAYTETDLHFIQQTIKLAREAIQKGEHPMAALLVKDNQLIAQSIDQSMQLSDPTAHAELFLISEFCRKQNLLSLKGYTIYSFVEPCVMCAGAIKWAKIDRVVFCVPQRELQRFSGGHLKPTCDSIVNTGGRKIPVTEGVLLEEGLNVWKSYNFKNKTEKK